MTTPDAAAAFPVSVQRVGRRYGDLTVLEDVSFHVAPGERFCLIGSNGAGKSTLLAILAGIRRPHAGTATLYGRDPADPVLKARRGIQLERPYFPYYAKVREIVWLFASMHPRSADVRELLDRSRLRGDAYVRHLSKGQRQRLALLLATIGDPELLILDEPTSGLDPEAKHGFWRAVDQHLRGGEGRALLFTTHELAEAEQWANRVAILHRGRIVADGAPDRLCRELIGAEMKVTVAVRDEAAVGPVVGLVLPHLVEGIQVSGSVVTLYTDRPKEVLEVLPIEDTVQVQVRHVSLEDVFLRVTGAGTTYTASHEIAAQPR